MNYSVNRNEVLAFTLITKYTKNNPAFDKIKYIHSHVKRNCYFELLTVYVKIIVC